MTDAESASYPTADTSSPVDWSDGGTVLAFLNEVAGGRRLLEALRERVDAEPARSRWRRRRTSRWSGRSSTATSSTRPQSRVDVTQEVLAEFGIEALARSSTPIPCWRSTTPSAPSPREVLLSSLYETRYGCCGATSWSGPRRRSTCR